VTEACQSSPLASHRSLPAESLDRIVARVRLRDELSRFAANDGTHGAELWRTDGTPDGTSLVGDLLPGPEGSAPYDFVEVGNALFMLTTFETELWTTDSTPEGTVRLLGGGDA
jgi:ELWxxDGT repeat protein